MNSRFDVPTSAQLHRRQWLAAAACLPLASWAKPQVDHSAHAGHSAPAARTALPAAQPFDETTWPPLLANGPRPAAYMFTASYCAVCPEAFAQLRQAVKAARRPVELTVVVMDLPAEQLHRHAHHYAGATQLFVFDGFEPAIRHSVDPKWRNITPYLVLVDKLGGVRRHTGLPPDKLLKAWLA